MEISVQEKIEQIIYQKMKEIPPIPGTYATSPLYSGMIAGQIKK
ncbi:MAG: hypothetical protein N0A00_08590 [Candidatus Bathyarchaeota archaeon]|nr:hypothetical protein [Candidatus Bathyarchaeota archaeon]